MKLHDYLSQLNITQSDFAAQLGVDRSWLSSIASGAARPGKHLAAMIASMTHGFVDADELIENSTKVMAKNKIIKLNQKMINQEQNKNLK